jgi:hypothetical protein
MGELTGRSRLLFPGSKPLLHSADMASRPVEAAAFGADPQWTAGGPRPFRHPRRRTRRRRLERPVVDKAAGERRVLPVDVKSDAQGSCGFVDAVSRKQHDRRNTRNGCGKLPVFG